jgi:hypothetical protein
MSTYSLTISGVIGILPWSYEFHSDSDSAAIEQATRDVQGTFERFRGVTNIYLWNMETPQAPIACFAADTVTTVRQVKLRR